MARRIACFFAGKFPAKNALETQEFADLERFNVTSQLRFETSLGRKRENTLWRIRLAVFGKHASEELLRDGLVAIIKKINFV